MATTTTVNSGGVTTQGSRTYLFGTSSGINTSALVEVAYNQRVREADKIDIQVSKNTKKSEAYTTLQTLSQAVQTSLANLKKTYGYSSTTNNYLFDARSGSMTTNNTTDPTKLLGVAIDAGTAKGTYELEVLQKAKAHRIGSSTSTDPTVALGYTGGFNIGLAGGTTSTVNVTSGMSLNDLATAINATSATSNVTASVLKISATSYQLVISGSEAAKNISISGITGTNVLQSIGVTTGTTPNNVLQTADQAIVKLDGITVTRDTNEFSDLITGVNISIKNAEPGTIIDLDIQNDTSAVKNGILSFAESYNAFRDFIITNQQVSDGEVSEDAVLFGDNLLKSLTTNVQNMIAGIYGNGGSALSTLRELGMTLDQNNRFVVDETILDTALLTKFDEVKSMFTTTISTNNSNFAVIGNTSKTKEITADISIQQSGGNITGVSVNGDNTLFDFSGTSITGKAGTIYEGLSFAYVGTVNAIVHFEMKQGVADLLNSTINDFTKAGTGLLEQERLNLGDVNTDMNARAVRVRERADEFRTKLIDRYAGFEAQIARSKSIISQLQAILGTNKSS